MGERIGFGVEHDLDIALTQQADRLRAMLTKMGKPELLQPGGQPCALGFIYRELEKLNAVITACRRWVEQYVGVDGLGVFFQQLAGLFFQVQQRAQAIRRIGSRRRGTEATVEDFKRQRPGVTAAQDRREESGQVKFTLAGEA